MKLVQPMFWRPDNAIEELRSRSGWTEFHREAGRRGFYFDLIVKDGKRYKMSAFTVNKTPVGGWSAQFLAEGAGKTPVDAFEAVYRATGRCDAKLDELMLRVKGGRSKPAVATPVETPSLEIDDIFDDAPVVEIPPDDEFDALFG